MSYEYITSYNANAYTVGRMSNGVQYSVDKIIIHHWGAEGQTFEGVCAWFESPSCQTSAHYVVEGGRVACLVNLSDTAYHAGDWGANLTSIGIECRPEMSDADLETVCELVAYLYKVYGELPIYGHKDFSSTACPGKYYNKLDYIHDRALELMNGDTVSTDTADNNEPSKWAKDAWNKAHELGLMDGTRPHDTVTREELAAVLVRLAEK